MALNRAPRVDPAAWASARNILCVRLDSMGDVVMTGPAIRAIAALPQTVPRRRLTLLTSPAGAAVAAMLPDLADTIAYRAPWMPGGDADPGSDLRLIDRLAARRFDAAVIFTTVNQSALPAATICRLAGIPLRAAHSRENPYAIVTDWLPDPRERGEPMHEVLRQLALATALGGRVEDDRLALATPPGALDIALEVLAHADVDEHDRCLVFHPGAGAPSRRYDPASFAAAADALAEDWRIIVTGGAEDRASVRAMIDAMHRPAVDLCGLLTLPVLVALLSQADALVTNNTGPAHLAAAVMTPVVDLYALTNTEHTPWRVPARVLFHDVPCAGCLSSVCLTEHHDCLGKVPPRAVVDAVHELTASDRLASGAQ